MDCCDGDPDPSSLVTDCPASGARGRRAKDVTVGARVNAWFVRRDAAWRLCATPGCEVAWFGEQSGQRIPRVACRVRIGQKETVEDRPVCYCFGYSAADVRAGLGADGGNAVADAITGRCRRGEDRCERTNPQGACCLGNVRAIRP
jgi:hypothetical protein